MPMVVGMNDRLRTRLAAGGTIAALGVLATVALAAGSGGRAEQPVSAGTIPPPQVRTQVERRTVHVRRHRDDPARTAAAAPASAVPAAAAPAAAPAPAPAAPVGDARGRGRENEAEHESGDDHGSHGRRHGGDD
jgi:hypothetical protein